MAIDDPVIAAQTPAADFSIEQRWDQYTDDEHAVWKFLYERQVKVLKGRAVHEFYDGLDALNLNDGGIPDFDIINTSLQDLTGWTVISVPHLIPDDIFFEHLARRRFPAGRFIRTRNRLDYLREPDIFHDVFGHVPLLTQPVFADYMQAYGEGGLRALKYNCLENLARLYWYTVEFGLMNTNEGMNIYGAGILSSRTETVFSLDSRSPNRIHFDLGRIMQTDYRIDDFQQVYFVINSFEELFEATQQDFGPIYDYMTKSDRVHGLTDILPGDRVYARGTQEYARQGGRSAKARQAL
ncbi:MAG: phenylalanine 4-monooxygenase [Hyphomonadaceae bacterium]|nr:phenylalanine 4-monooxygenase [Hyphomonadaceae bacterium]MBC6411709.1 phenylalanine 4-monooxygenase [Hyphomonadaceae bacterium]